MTWTKLIYSNNQVNKAGDILNDQNSSGYEKDRAIDILNNWRSAHSFPLHTFTARLKNLSKQIDQDALVTRRLKRVTSILNKLVRGQTSKMKMSRMQDVGGCRSVLQTISKAKKLIEKYENKRTNRGLKHKLVNKKDYINHPKPDGYRSYHLIYKYYSDKKQEYDGLLIEIQIRTNLQHYWATAVETVDHFTRQAIKSNEGEKEWMDFFKLVSSAFAGMEKTPPVPDTPTDENALRNEILTLARQLKVVKKMTEWTKIHQIIENFEKNAKDKYDFYLLDLDLSTKKLEISAFRKAQEELANTEYTRLEEKMLRNKEDRDIVLVSADTTKELRRAYPNYFLDAKEFINQLNEYLRKKKGDR